MAVESDADRTALFNTDEFAVEAAYQAPQGGALVDCRVIHDRSRREPFELPAGGDTGMRGAYAWERAQILLTGDLPPIERGGTLYLKAENVPLKIVSRPKVDETGTICTVDLERPS